MNIAVLSDSHDNLSNLAAAVERIEKNNITHVFHLGDFCCPSVIEFMMSTQLLWTCVWGNNDVEPLKNYKVPHNSNVDIERCDFRELLIDERCIFLTHYPQIARMSALSGKYDACFFGHSHRESQEMITETLLANPGEIIGNRFKNPSFGIYNTTSNTFVRVPLSD